MSEKNIYDIVPELKEGELSNTKKVKKKKRKTKKGVRALIVSLICLLVAALIVVGVIFGIPYYKKLTAPKFDEKNMPVMFITSEGPELIFYNEQTGKTESVASSLFGRTSTEPYVIYDITPDGKSFFFIDEYGDFYRRNLDLSTSNVFIAENILSFSIDNYGNLVYLNNNGILTRLKWNRDRITFNIETIDNSVDGFKYSENGDAVVYTKTQNNISSLYKATFKFKTKTQLLINNCGELLAETTDDLSSVYTLKTSDNGKRSVYITDSRGNTYAAAEGVDRIYTYGHNGTVLYGIKSDTKVDLKDFFTDEKKAADAEIKEPDYGDVIYGNISMENFLVAYNEWSDKVLRDSIREMLSDETLSASGYDLYKYENGKAVSIDKNVIEIIKATEDNETVVYEVLELSGSSEETLGDISEWASADEAFEAIRELLSSGKRSYKLSMNGHATTKNLYNANPEATTEVTVNSQADALYIYEKTEENAVIKFVDFALGNVSTPAVVTEKATGKAVLAGEKIVITETTDEDKTISFFASGLKRVDIGENVKEDSVINEEVVLYLADKDENDNYKLVLKGEKEKVIAENVTSVIYKAPDKIFFVALSEKAGWAIYHYNGTEVHSIGANLSSVLSF